MLACQIADKYSVDTKIARVSNPDYFSTESGLTAKDFGIDLLINPEQLCVTEFVRLLQIPEAREIVEFEDGRIQLVSFRVKQSNPLIGKSFSELDTNGLLSDIRFPAISRRVRSNNGNPIGNGNRHTIIPSGSDALQHGDDVFVIGSAIAVEQLLRISGITFNQQLDRVINCGRESYRASHSPLHLKRTTPMSNSIESDATKAELASRLLRRTTVLHGNYLKFRLLEEAGVEDVNGFVSVTGDDENDIMACMTAKENGAQRALALVQQPRYLPLLARIPRLDGAVSRHLTVVSNILRLIRRGNIISVASLHGIDAEVIEIVAGVNAKIVHKELAFFKTKFPENAFICAILRRGETHYPDRTICYPTCRSRYRF